MNSNNDQYVNYHVLAQKYHAKKIVNKMSIFEKNICWLFPIHHNYFDGVVKLLNLYETISWQNDIFYIIIDHRQWEDKM